MEEEQQLGRSLLGKEKYDKDEERSINNGDAIASLHGECSSSTTFIVVLSTLVAVCGSYSFGNAVGYSSPAETGIVDDLGLTTAEYSVFGSILTIGAMFGAIRSGRIADLMGRRGAMGISQVFCIIGWLAIAFSKSACWLDIGRFLVGYGTGLLAYVVPVYVAEITPKNVRGAFVSLNQLMIGCGKAIMFLIGSLVNWRTSAIIGTIPCVVQLIGLFFIPESPRWLAKIGRVKEFEATLQWLRGENADISQEAVDIKDYTDYLHQISEDGILNQFQWKYACSIIVGVGVMVFQQSGGLNGFVFYSSTIFESAGLSTTAGNITAGVFQIIMCPLELVLIDKLGRRPLLLISAAGTCLGCVLTGFSFLLQDLDCWKELIPILVLIGVLIFPINIKGSAGSLVNWFFSWLVAYTFNFLFEWSTEGAFLIYAAICGTGVAFIAKLLPETKVRTLEEIQESMTQSAIGD